MLSQKRQVEIAVVDDHNLFRKGLIKLINLGDREGRYNILFEAENGIELMENMKQPMPDIVIMDIDMPDMDGYEAVIWLKNYFPDIHILVVSMFDSSEHIMRMLKLGVNGYLSKDIEVKDMHTALESIIRRGSYYSDFTTGIMASALKNNDITGKNETDGWNGLSETEKTFLRLACTDLNYMQIAERMHMSPKTIDGYRENLFKRFNVKNRVGLAMYAVRKGLVKI